MKALLAALILSVSVNAQFSDIETITCDGVDVEVKAGDRLFFDPVKSVIGFGETTEDNCKVVDFMSLVLIHSSSIEGNTESTYQAVSKIGRRSSCKPGEIIEYKGPELVAFNKAENKLSLSTFGTCDFAVITLKK